MTGAAARENSLLGKVTLITSLGDFISLFAVLKWVSNQGYGPEVAGYSVVVKSIAVGAGAALLPSALTRVATRQLIVLSQLGSAVMSALLLIAIFIGNAPIEVIFAILFVQTLFKQIFDGARETHSKVSTSDEHQMSFQAQLLANFYSSQFIGPLISFVLIHFLPLEIPVVLDLVSFIVATVMAMRLRNSEIKIPQIHVLKPFVYIWAKPLLRDIFFLRSVVFWASIGLFNYLLFSVITNHYGLSIEHSAFVYSTLGLGAALSSMTLRKMKTKISEREGMLAAFSQVVFAVAILAFRDLPSFTMALLVLFVAGLAMGANTVATQTLRRRLTTNSQFPEVVSLEVIVGRLTDGVISSAAKASLLAAPLLLPSWLALAAGVLFCSGVVHLRFSKKLSGLVNKI